MVTCRALGVLEIDQKKKTGDRDEIAAFFIEATAFEDKDVQVLGWQGPEQALALLGAP